MLSRDVKYYIPSFTSNRALVIMDFIASYEFKEIKKIAKNSHLEKLPFWQKNDISHILHFFKNFSCRHLAIQAFYHIEPYLIIFSVIFLTFSNVNCELSRSLPAIIEAKHGSCRREIN